MTDGNAAPQVTTGQAPQAGVVDTPSQNTQDVEAQQEKPRRNRNKGRGPQDPRVANRTPDPRRAQNSDPRRRQARPQKAQPAPKPQAVTDQGGGDGPKRERPPLPPGVTSRKKAEKMQSLSFMPTVSHPYFERELKINSEFTYRLYEEYAGRCQVALYNLLILLPIKVNQYSHHVYDADTAVDLLEQFADEAMSTMARNLDADIENRRADAEAYNVGKINYTNPRSVVLKVYTPAMEKFLNVLELFDRYVVMVDGLWARGALGSSRERRELIGNHRGELVRFVRKQMHHYREIDRMLKLGEAEGKVNMDIRGYLVEKSREVKAEDANLPDRLSDEDEAMAKAFTSGSNIAQVGSAEAHESPVQSPATADA